VPTTRSMSLPTVPTFPGLANAARPIAILGRHRIVPPMSQHGPRTGSRQSDVAVIGGSAAGLAAALQLGRQRRSVIVVDAEEPRNAPAAHMHSYLGHEGVPPSELTAIGREEVRSYGVEVLTGRVVEVTRTEDGRFTVELAGGHTITARRVLAATGLVDELPDIEGLVDQWGGAVVHCPFCHGFEARDRRIVQIVTHPMGLHPAGLWRQLSGRFTMVLHDGVDPDAPEVQALRAAGVAVVEGRVRRVLTGEDGHVVGVELGDGERIDADVVAVGPRFRARAEAFASLGLVPVGHSSGLGDVLEVGPMGETSVPGLFAAGNVTDPRHQVLQAAAHGSLVGGTIAFSLAGEDIESAARPSPHEAEWDARYGGGPVWSGKPNGALVAEVDGLPPGRALDIGAGEGGDAIWLAEQGWRVTAGDVSQRALDRIAAVARERGLPVECHHTDADALGAFEAGAFDLVSAHYVPIPRAPDGRGIRNVLEAVGPGGTLLVVGHDLSGGEHRPFVDPDAYVGPDDFSEALAGRPGWEVEVHERRPRPEGHASPHVHDIVLRARRGRD
jgi:thioredoxin reductase/SAM-dependent methyltransferase